MTEKEVQSKIKAKLTKAGWRVVKVIQLSENGWPDLMALRNGQTAFIECKRPGRAADPLQSYRIEELNKMGFIAFCTDNPNDIDCLLK